MKPVSTSAIRRTSAGPQRWSTGTVSIRAAQPAACSFGSGDSENVKIALRYCEPTSGP